MAQLLANAPRGGPVEGEGGLFALKASDSSGGGYGVVGITAAVDILGDMRGTSPLNPRRTIAGVYGISDLPVGPDIVGVLGEALNAGSGVRGVSQNEDGVQGIARQTGSSGVTGLNIGGGNGVFGQSETGRGVAGTSNTGIGVFGQSAGNDGVQGQAAERGHSGVAGIHTGGGNGIFGQGSPAGRFAGDVDVTGTINAFDFVVAGGDCAEGFDVASGETFDPGSVMVFDDSGLLRECDQDYDRRVAGVISGAGPCHPGILLGQRSNNRNRQPIALIGKVFCRVDANRSPIEVGDLLTTSKLPGHAMKAVDPAQAFGAVIGKAMGALASGQGLIPILVALQ